jgi:putative tricarboxylic transport membrane protein
VQRVDRWVGLALAVLGAAVLWSARAFPDVPGQKLGASFLPMLVGAGLVVCSLLLVQRSFRAPPGDAEAGDRPREQWLAPVAVVASVAAYLALADRLGFLLVAPPCLFVLFLTFGRRATEALLWSLGGAAVVHLVFYKLLRVPLPWGVLHPFY